MQKSDSVYANKTMIIILCNFLWEKFVILVQSRDSFRFTFQWEENFSYGRSVVFFIKNGCNL